MAARERRSELLIWAGMHVITRVCQGRSGVLCLKSCLFPFNSSWASRLRAGERAEICSSLLPSLGRAGRTGLTERSCNGHARSRCRCGCQPAAASIGVADTPGVGCGTTTCQRSVVLPLFGDAGFWLSEDSVFYLGALGLVWLIESALRLLLRLRLRLQHRDAGEDGGRNSGRSAHELETPVGTFGFHWSLARNT